MTTLPIRQEQSASYKTLIKSSLVTSLRSVFTESYHDPQFQNLRIDPEFSLTRVTWPAIYIRYNEGEVRNAGVGHLEFFADPSGFIRKWMHSVFVGNIEFDIITESPLDRDILSDALVEVIRFGTLDPLLSNFFTGIYGNVTDPYSNLAVMQQIALNSDTLVSQGESFAPSPWGAEDLPIYQTSYSIDIFGGYYNTLPMESSIYVREVIQFPYIDDSLADDLPFDEDPSNMWFYPFTYYDEDYVQSKATMFSRETLTSDQDMVIGRGRISGADTEAGVDIGVMTATAKALTQETIIKADQGDTVTSSVEIGSTDTFSAADHNITTSVSVCSSLDGLNYQPEAATVSVQANMQTVERTAMLESGQQATSTTVIVSVDQAQFIDAGSYDPQP